MTPMTSMTAIRRVAATCAPCRGRSAAGLALERCPRRFPLRTKTCCATCSSTARIKTDRTGTGTRSVFGRQLRFDLSQGFPLITTKRVHFKSIAYELLWFLQGSSNVGWLQENGVTIWDEWADADGRARPGLRRAVAVVADALGRDASTRSRDVIEQIRVNPDSRRLIVSAWNPGRHPRHGARAVPRAVPVLRRRRQAVVPALPAQRRPVPRRAVQHRLLRAAHAHGRAADRASRSATSCGPAATATSTTTTSSRCASSSRATRTRRPTLRIARTPDSIFDYEYDDFVVEDYQHHPAIRARRRGMSGAPAIGLDLGRGARRRHRRRRRACRGTCPKTSRTSRRSRSAARS